MEINKLINNIDELISTIDGISKKPYKKEGAKQSTKLIDEYALSDDGLKILFEKTYLNKIITKDISVKNFETINIGDLEGGNGIQALSLARALFLIGVKKVNITIYSSLLSLKNNDGKVIKEKILNFNGGSFLTINIENQNILLNDLNHYDIVIFDEFKSKSSSPINTDKLLEIDNRLLIDQTLMLISNLNSQDLHFEYNVIMRKGISSILLQTKISKNTYIKSIMNDIYRLINLSNGDININSFDVLSDNVLLQTVIEDVLSTFYRAGKTDVPQATFKREFKKSLINEINTVFVNETQLKFNENIHNQLVHLSNNIGPSFSDTQKYIINSALLIHKDNVLKGIKDSVAKKIHEFIIEMNSVEGYLHEDELRDLNVKAIKKLFNEPESDSQGIIRLLELIKYKFHLLDFFKHSILISPDTNVKFIIQVGKNTFEDFAQIGVNSLEIINENPIKTVVSKHEEFIKIIDLNYKQKIINDLIDSRLESDLEVVRLATDVLVSNKDIKIAMISKEGTGKKTYYLYYEKEKPIIKLDTVNLKNSFLKSIQDKSKTVTVENIQTWYKSCYDHLGRE